MEAETVLIGHGVVGRATGSILHEPWVAHDPRLGLVAEPKHYRTAVVCTPCLDGRIDCPDELADFAPSEIVVRSTVLPSAFDDLRAVYPDAWLVHWPEWLSAATADADAAEPDKVVVGVTDGDVDRAERRMRELCGERWPVPALYVDVRASTLAKLGVNSYYALKVWLLNALYEAAGSDRRYSEICSVLAMDQRIHLSHARPWTGGYQGFGGHCIPKDLGLLGRVIEETVGLDDFDVIRAVLEANAARRDRSRLEADTLKV